MSRFVRLASMAAVVFGIMALTAHAQAQCGFEHPRSAKQFKSYLTQAMIPCNEPGGHTPNTTTEGGVPACAPPETENEDDGSPISGWVWNPSSSGVVYLKARKNKELGALNPSNSADLGVTLKLDNIHDGHGVVAHAPGKLIVTLRVTMQDRQGGNMTTIDWPIEFDFMVQGADATMKTTVNKRLNEQNVPSLPGCSSIEVVGVIVLDENGNRFATDGVFLPRGSS